MEYTVSATDLANIQLNEEDRVKEILRNVAVILATPKGSVPMYRSFGLDMSFLEKADERCKKHGRYPSKGSNRGMGAARGIQGYKPVL